MLPIINFPFACFQSVHPAIVIPLRIDADLVSLIRLFRFPPPVWLQFKELLRTWSISQASFILLYPRLCKVPDGFSRCAPESFYHPPVFRFRPIRIDFFVWSIYSSIDLELPHFFTLSQIFVTLAAPQRLSFDPCNPYRAWLCSAFPLLATSGYGNFPSDRGRGGEDAAERFFFFTRGIHALICDCVHRIDYFYPASTNNSADPSALCRPPKSLF